MDPPKPLDPAWSMARVDRCNTLIWHTALAVAARGTPCILDIGFSSTEQRARFFRLAGGAGLSARLHFVDVPPDERWRRVQNRNDRKGNTYQLSFEVTREMFDFVEALFEPPTDDEMHAADGVHVKE